MATVANVLTYSQQLCQTDTNGIDSTNWGNNGSSFANDALQNITRALIERNVDAAQIQESYTNLGTSSPNTYAWPSDMWMLKTIEINFIDQNRQNYLQADPVEVSNLQNMSFDWLRVNQPQASPLFKNYGDTFEVFPIPATSNTNGIKIFYYLTPTEFTAFANTVPYPLSLDYRCLSARVAALYAISIKDTDLQQAAQIEYEHRLKDIINILAPQSQQPIHPDRLHMSGWNF